MKKFFVLAIFSLPLFFLSTHSSFAESVAVEGDLIFVADKGLVVRNLSDGMVNQCLASPFLDPLGADVTDLLTTATDVLIEDTYAVVTVETTTELGTFDDVVVVDAANCFVPDDDIDVTQCISTVDLDEGVLIIPCVEVDGKVVTVHMEQRGNSSNWEVSFLGANINFDGHDDEEDHDDDNNVDDGL